jgi:uncharacterized phage-associated protein
MATEKSTILDQIAPFNATRFDLCMAYYCQRYKRELTQYDMVKLHLMTDIFHTLEQAKPVVGGSVQAWDFGPVIDQAYRRIKHWDYSHDETGSQPDTLRILNRRGNSCEFINSQQIDKAEFTDSELNAMERAWDSFMHMNWNESQRFFHEDSFIGRSWSKARQERRNIDWDDIIDEYDKEHGTNHTHIKALIRF